MGTVYKVQHLISDRIEAMKVVLPELIDSSELADRFIREIKVQARLSHPNIASLHNALRLGDQFLMVMEYVDGSSLHARLRQGAIDPGASLEIILQVLSALAYAHGQGVIHRDIKPANIMLTSGGVAKLMDFGIARSLTDQHLTRAGAAVGSVYYMSPEQIQAAEVDSRSDLYSVGIMLYEMATGTRPIAGDSSWAVMNAHLHQIPRSPSVVNPKLPAAFSLAILKAIEKNPADRYQAASEFSDTLKAIPGLLRSENRAYNYRLMQPHATEVADRGAVPHDIAKAPGASLHAPVGGANPAAPVTPVSSPPPGGGAPGSLGVRFDSDGLERVTRELAIYVGPMARLLVSRTAKKAVSWKQLYDLLATEVPEGPERKQFLSKKPA
jgi:serine/threonine-protein kinase